MKCSAVRKDFWCLTNKVNQIIRNFLLFFDSGVTNCGWRSGSKAVTMMEELMILFISSFNEDTHLHSYYRTVNFIRFSRANDKVLLNLPLS